MAAMVPGSVNTDFLAALEELVLERRHGVQVKGHRGGDSIGEPEFSDRRPARAVPDELDQVANVLTVSQSRIDVAESLEILLQVCDVALVLSCGLHILSSSSVLPTGTPQALGELA